MMEIKASDKKIYLLGDASADTLIILHADLPEGEEVVRECERLGCGAICVAVIDGIDWERDLSPWEAPAVFARGSAFGGGADVYREALMHEILDAIEAARGKKAEKYILAGYSLAGLFALYMGFCTDRFCAIVSASGSLWFPDFAEYVKEHDLSQSIQAVYLSLGDQEVNTKNPVMKTVAEKTELIAENLRSRGVPVRFEMNEGGHFKDAGLRTAKGIAAVLEEIA